MVIICMDLNALPAVDGKQYIFLQLQQKARNNSQIVGHKV